MKLILSILILLFGILFILPVPSFAADNPLAVANNKVGIHILFPSELPDAARLVNSDGGDWGYVIIPIQSGDKDLVKWQTFMADCKKYHVIPIIRLATEGDYFNTKVWRVPTEADVLDFANFLNSLDWPIKNRYIVVYNEVNRGDEWGGSPDPAAYANLLSYAISTFKSKNTDFFLISAGMDNAAATTSQSIDEYQYYFQMNQAVPGIFGQIDGFGSHSYPNPAFSQAPNTTSPMGVGSFAIEKQALAAYTNKNLPVFITETGWDQHAVGQQTAATYLASTYQTIWNSADIVAVTPFLLRADGAPFDVFSFLTNGAPNPVYNAIASLKKIKGAPSVNPDSTVLAANTTIALPTEGFSDYKPSPFATTFEQNFKLFFKFFLQVR